MEMNPFCKKNVAFMILKLKFTKLGYFLRLSEFLLYKNIIQKKW